MSENTTAGHEITRADRILRDVLLTAWPASHEATATIRQSARYLMGELDVCARLLDGSMDWPEFDPDLEYAGDPGLAAIEAAARRALDAALALKNDLARYRRQEQAAAKLERVA
jgi:hypothetical protein